MREESLPSLGRAHLRQRKDALLPAASYVWEKTKQGQYAASKQKGELRAMPNGVRRLVR